MRWKAGSIRRLISTRTGNPGAISFSDWSLRATPARPCSSRLPDGTGLPLARRHPYIRSHITRSNGHRTMHTHSLDKWTHDHVFLGQQHAANERRTWSVVILTAVMMVSEI